MPAFTYGGVDIDLFVEIPRGDLNPMAPIARRGATGNVLSAITTQRGQKLNLPGLRTIPLDPSDADTQETALAEGIPKACTGPITGSITALARNVRREPIAGGALSVIHFDLME